jgi:hypothetical protein
LLVAPLVKTAAEEGAPTAPASGDRVAPDASRSSETPSETPAVEEPSRTASAAQPAPIFEQSGVLTPRGKLVLEPSLQYSYSSTNRVALLGYTVIPSVTVGLINVQQVKSESFVGALTVRYGVTARWEVEARVPFVYRAESTVALPLNTGSSTSAPVVASAPGKGIGDVELATRYQLNDGGPDGLTFIGSLRFKTRSGKDPFQVQVSQQASGFNGASLQTELPRGSGFLDAQPGLSFLLPSDPAVFFGGLSYVRNFARHGVYQTTDGEPVRVGKVAAGDILTLNFGVGIALNGKTSLSLGYEQDSVNRTFIEGSPVSGSTRIELGTLALGASVRTGSSSTLSVAVGVGVTRDTPDVTVTIRLPQAY